MATQNHKPSAFLTIPWGLLSIVMVLVLNLTLNGVWFQKNWSWIALVLIIPAAILENFKVGYSTMRIMFMKVVYSLLSFLLAGLAFGSALTGWHIEKFQKDVTVPVKTIQILQKSTPHLFPSQIQLTSISSLNSIHTCMRFQAWMPMAMNPFPIHFR